MRYFLQARLSQYHSDLHSWALASQTLHIKAQVKGGFRRIYWQKWNIMFIIMFSVVYNHLFHMFLQYERTNWLRRGSFMFLRWSGSLYLVAVVCICIYYILLLEIILSVTLTAERRFGEQAYGERRSEKGSTCPLRGKSHCWSIQSWSEWSPLSCDQTFLSWYVGESMPTTKFKSP